MGLCGPTYRSILKIVMNVLLNCPHLAITRWRISQQERVNVAFNLKKDWERQFKGKNESMPHKIPIWFESSSTKQDYLHDNPIGLQNHTQAFRRLEKHRRKIRLGYVLYPLKTFIKISKFGNMWIKILS